MELSNKPVIAFGELLWDVLPTGKVLGGAPANFAFRLSTLNNAVHLVSRVGADENGDEALEMLGQIGVPAEYVQRDLFHPTGTVDVILSDSGNASYTINQDVAYDYIESTPLLLEEASFCSAICFGTLAQRSDTSRRTLHELLEASNKAVKIYDINLRKDCWTPGIIRESLRATNILKLNDDEVRVLSELFSIPCEDLTSFGMEMVNQFDLEACLITRGALGVIGVSKGGEVCDIPGIEVEVIDTIGSGDAFTAGFVSDLLNGASFPRCCENGNRLGALVAGTKGGMTVVSRNHE